MKELLSDSAVFGVVLSILAFQLGSFLKKKWKLAIFNPIFVAVALIIVLLVLTGINFESFNKGGQYFTFLLTPATVCFAVPLYEQLSVLKKNAKAVLAGIISGVLTSAVCIFVCALVFRFSHEMYVTLLPKSITTAIGMGQAEVLGGIPTITVAVIAVTGVFGNMIAETVCRLFRITEPVAKGIAIGSSSHAAGTAKAMEMGEVEGAMSSLSIVISGLLTVVVASVFANFI
ncbi:MAG: LrgB family protein [Clostridia bacterium]|nr:LrgB family protein [Clostridia bacterium]